jgi:alpha-glucosidase (family GH31 glycosyl hydrolase)
VPYLYTLARQAYDTGLPLARAMYLGWPHSADAYRFERQYTLGNKLLVAPVARPGDPARKRIWFPPGDWIDVFTGEVHSGPRVETLSVPLDRMPLFARAGAIIPNQKYVEHVGRGAPDPLILNVYAGADGSFDLYEDQGVGFGYRSGKFTRTPLRWDESTSSSTLTIGPAAGSYPGDPASRSYSVRVFGVAEPTKVTVGGRNADVDYDAKTRVVTINTVPLPTHKPASVLLSFGRR